MKAEEKNSILVVDDEESIRKFLAEALLFKGYEVSEACGYDEALDILEHQKIDLLITDYSMTGKNGLELLIEARELYPGMARILFTGMGEKDLYREAINRAAIFSVIEKPVSTQTLYDTVEKALEFRSSRIRDQEEIKILQEQYHSIFDLTSDLIQCADVIGNLIYVNPAWYMAMGYDKEDLKKINLFDLIHDDYREKIREIITRVQDGEIVETFETVMISKERIPVYLEGTVTAQGQKEDVVAVSFILRDVTERRRSEEELQARLKQEIMIARTAHLLATAEEPAFVTPAILEIVGESAGVDRAYIYSVEETKKKFSKVDVWCSTPEGDDSQWEDEIPFKKLPWIYEKMKNESIISFSSREDIPKPDRSFMEKHGVMANLIFPIRTGITVVGILGFDVLDKPRMWENNEVSILRASVDIIANAWTRQQEIDYRREKEREAKQSRLLITRADRLAALGTMAAGIIHEITQPLNAINISTQTIQKALSRGLSPDDSKVKDSLNLIDEQIKRMNELISGMRTFARDDLPAEKEKGNLNDPVHRVFAMLGEQMKAHGIEFSLDLGEIPDIEMNSQQILQIILNLVTNAREALDEEEMEDKKITISTYKKGVRNVILSVSDNGPGIPEKLREKIFDPFFTTKDVGKGTGLGLSISSGIAADHNGVLDIQTNENGGATFVVQLPLKQKVKASRKS